MLPSYTCPFSRSNTSRSERSYWEYSTIFSLPRGPWASEAWSLWHFLVQMSSAHLLVHLVVVSIAYYWQTSNIFHWNLSFTVQTWQNEAHNYKASCSGGNRLFKQTWTGFAMILCLLGVFVVSWLQCSGAMQRWNSALEHHKPPCVTQYVPKVGLPCSVVLASKKIRYMVKPVSSCFVPIWLVCPWIHHPGYQCGKSR